jgi:hypothetical protein
MNDVGFKFKNQLQLLFLKVFTFYLLDDKKSTKTNVLRNSIELLIYANFVLCVLFRQLLQQPNRLH